MPSTKKQKQNLNNSMKSQVEALKVKLLSILQDTHNDFKNSLPKGFSKSQQDGISNSTNKQLEQSKLVLKLIYDSCRKDNQRKKMFPKTHGSKVKKQMTNSQLHEQPKIERTHGKQGESLAIKEHKSREEEGERL